MRALIYKLRGYLVLPVALLLWLVMNKRQRRLTKADCRQWYRWQHIGEGWTGFAYLVANYPEYRSVLYRRMGPKRLLCSWFLRPLRDLYINTRDIGGGLLIQHGFSTIISAKRIGENCKIYHHVTLGYNHELEAPVLGDNVEVCCGAKVLGGVTVGDNVLIGAGAVVVKDVPANSVIAGVPARVIKTLDQQRDLTL